MHDVLNPFYNTFPSVIGAILILIIGIIVAAVLSSLVRGVLRRTGLDQRIASRVFGPERAATMDIASGVGRAVYYLILIFVAIAVLNALHLTVVTQPLTTFLDTILAYLPRLIGAALLFVVAWLLATILRAVVVQALRAFHVDERLARSSATAPAADQPQSSFSHTLGEVVYYLVFLFFLPAILGALGLAGLLAPVQSLVGIVLAFLPRLISAAIIFVVGLFVARLVRRIVADLLAAAGLDRFSERIGLGTAAGGMRMSDLLGLVVYVLILIPVVTASLDALQLGAVTQPISNMLNRILLALPNIFAAAVLLAIAYAVSRVVANVVTSLLTGFGFNHLVAQLGIGQAATVTAPESRTPAGYIGTLAQIVILFFATIEALQLLGFLFVATLISQFMVLAGHIILGLIIFAIGVFIARWAARAVHGSGVAQAGLLAFVAQAAILVLAGAMALRQMGVADDIINLAFGLLLGAVAVAAAIAFGVGGREVAGRELAHWVDATRPPTPPSLPPTSPMSPAGSGPSAGGAPGAATGFSAPTGGASTAGGPADSSPASASGPSLSASGLSAPAERAPSGRIPDSSPPSGSVSDATLPSATLSAPGASASAGSTTDVARPAARAGFSSPLSEAKPATLDTPAAEAASLSSPDVNASTSVSETAGGTPSMALPHADRGTPGSGSSSSAPGSVTPGGQRPDADSGMSSSAAPDRSAPDTDAAPSAPAGGLPAVDLPSAIFSTPGAQQPAAELSPPAASQDDVTLTGIPHPHVDLGAPGSSGSERSLPGAASGFTTPSRPRTDADLSAPSASTPGTPEAASAADATLPTTPRIAFSSQPATGAASTPAMVEAQHGQCPLSHPIKGNVRRDGSRVYHTSQSPNYTMTMAEACFATEAAAQAAGYRPAHQH